MRRSVEGLPNNGKREFVGGNQAVAEAAIRAGCRAYYGYPITPQSQIAEYMARRMPEVGGVFLQTESEIAAINAVYGSSAAGIRSMTSSASTAWSLKQEGISQLAYMELPAVIVDTMRGGPGLGNPLPTQGDYLQATRGGGSGDYNTLVLAPHSVQEVVDLTMLAFDLADTYRNPVVILVDGVIARMMEPVVFPDQVALEELPGKPWALTGAADRPRRVIEPCNTAEDLERRNIHLQLKFEEMERRELRYELYQVEDAEVVFVAFGICARICKLCVLEGRKAGMRLGLLRPVSLWPFPYGVVERLTGCAGYGEEDTGSPGRAFPAGVAWSPSGMADQRRLKAFFVVEMNAGQMWWDVRFAARGHVPVYFHGRTGGMLPSEEDILRGARSIIDSGGRERWGLRDGGPDAPGIWRTA